MVTCVIQRVYHTQHKCTTHVFLSCSKCIYVWNRNVLQCTLIFVLESRHVNDACLLTFSAVSGNKPILSSKFPSCGELLIKSNPKHPGRRTTLSLSVKSSIIYCLFKTKHSRCFVTVVQIIISVIYYNVL